MLQPFNHSIFLELARDLFSILRVHRGNMKFTDFDEFRGRGLWKLWPLWKVEEDYLRLSDRSGRSKKII